MFSLIMGIPILAYAAYWDHRCRIIPNKVSALLITVTFLQIILPIKGDFFISVSERILGGLLPAMILFLLYKLNQRGLGGGDYKLILSLGLLIGITSLSFVLMIASALSIMYCIVKRVKEVPFAIPIFISYCFYCCSFL